MRQTRQEGRVFLLIVVAIIITVAVLGFSMRTLPDAPLYPTPTFPKAIDFPDSRPVPAR
jgi:hypothetical protein